MSTLILVSVIIPTYNNEKTIEKSIISVCRQTYKNIEIIVINDGSTDNTFNLCKNLKRLDNRIILKSVKNTGVSNARNIGLSIAKGDYILFLDGDDTLNKGMIDEYCKIAMKYNPDVVIGGLTFFNCGKIKKMMPKTFGLFDKSIWHDICSDRLYGYIASKMYRNSIIKKYNILFNTKMYSQEDFNFSLNFFDKCNSFYLLENSDYCYNFHTSNRKVPYNDLLKNQILLNNIACKYVILTNVEKKLLATKIYNLIYNWLYSANTFIYLKNIINYINDTEEIFKFTKKNNYLVNERLIKDIFNKRYINIYLYFFARKKLGSLKRKLGNYE